MSLLPETNMTRIEFTRNKTKRKTSHLALIYHHHEPKRLPQPTPAPTVEQPMNLKLSMRRRSLRWRVPSIVLLLSSCLVFVVVLLTFEYGNCTPFDAVDSDRKLSSLHHGHNRHRTTASNHRHQHNLNTISHHSKLIGHDEDDFMVVDGRGLSPEARKLFDGQSETNSGQLNRISSRSSINGRSSDEFLVASGKGNDYNNNFETSNNQQVPEQALPIVVSSSDNSYVSASPIETTTTTTTPPQTTTTQTTFIANANYFNGTPSHFKNNHHNDAAAGNRNHRVQRARLRSHNYYPTTTPPPPQPPISSIQNKHEQQQKQEHHRQQQTIKTIAPSAFQNHISRTRAPKNWNLGQRAAPMHTKRLFANQARKLDEDDDDDDEEEEEEKGDDVIYNGRTLSPFPTQEQLTSSDISTTATTTQRNKIRLPHHTKQHQDRHHNQRNYNLVRQSILAKEIERSQRNDEVGGHRSSKSGRPLRSQIASSRDFDDDQEDDDDADDDDADAGADDDDDDVDSDLNKDNSDDSYYGTRSKKIGHGKDQISTSSNSNSYEKTKRVSSRGNFISSWQFASTSDHVDDDDDVI